MGVRGNIFVFLLSIVVITLAVTERAEGQCALITDNYSGQVPSSVCAPVNLSMDVRYKFILPVNPANVQILYVWNDGTGATTLLPAVSHGDTVYTATASHVYPPADHCSYTAEAYVVYDGVQCVSSSRQEQTFSAWARDNQNGAEIITDPVVAQFCEGEDIIDVRFRDNSTFNCNVNIEPDKPNRITRWVQFIYGTTSIGGDRIPNITIRDPLGNVYQMTDAAGNNLPPVSGPIVAIPIPADGPTEISWPISAPAGGLAGDIFEITLRNWNICNPYDRNPFDANPPTDPVNGDYPPITTTALIEIITTPPRITNPSLEFCAGSPINLTLSTSGGTVNWYTDSLLTHHIHTGTSFNPTGDPTYIDNSHGGTYSFWVTESLGACTSVPSKVSFTIFDTPAPAPDAGDDAEVCRDTYILQGNTIVTGIGVWSTTSTAIIDDPLNPHSTVRNLEPGANLFRWTVSNGPCVSVDEVLITRDLQPSPAIAGLNQSFCSASSATLHGNNPNNQGVGTWSVVAGNAVFNDSHNPGTQVTSLAGGINRLVWEIRSQFSACVTSTDTMEIIRDLNPDPANAGANRGICDSTDIRLSALPATNGGSGTWSVVTGTAVFTDVHDPVTRVTGMAYGSTRLRWTVVSRFGICPGSSDDMIINRDQAPLPAFAGLDQDLCNALSTPLAANSASVGSGSWSVVSIPATIPPTFLPSPASPAVTLQIQAGNEGIYRLAWTIVNASCRTSDTIRVDFGKPVPQAVAGPGNAVCGLSAPLTGNDAGIGTGTWRKLSGTGPVTFTPSANARNALATITAGTEGAYQFEWRIVSGSCPPTADTTAVVFKPMPGLPASAGTSRCGPGSVTLTATLGTNGTGVRWYDMQTGGTLLATGLSFTTPVLAVNTDFWVCSFNSITGCESERRQVSVTVHPVPAIPVSSDSQHCGSASLTLSAAIGANGNTNRWYNAATGGTMLLQDTNFVTPVLSANTAYWVSSYHTVTGCESGRRLVQVRIDPIPAVPVALDSSRCGEGALDLVSTPGSNGTDNRWYDAAIGGTLIDTALIFHTPYLTASAVFWVETLNRNTGCHGARVKVNATVHPVPGYPNAADVIRCGTDSVLLPSSPGADGNVNRWYDSLTGGSMLHQGNDFMTPVLSTTTRYFVSTYNTVTHCESSRRDISAIILPIPGPNPILGPAQVGINQTNVIYSVNFHPGSTYAWDIPPGMNVLLSNMNFVIVGFPNLGTYNLSMVESNAIGCPGPRSDKQIVVSDKVIVLDINTTLAEGCEDTDLPLSVNPSGGTPSYSFSWGGDSRYLSAVNTSNPVFHSPVQGNFAVTVTVTDINGYHTSDTIEIRVHGNPALTIQTADSAVCTGATLSLNAQATGGSGIYTRYTWTGDVTPLSATDIPNPLFNSLVRDSYHLQVTVADHFGCMAADSIVVENESPFASFTTDAIPSCSPVVATFTNQSDHAVNYFWDFGDGETGTDPSPVHRFKNVSNSVQYFNVRLTASNEHGCIHTTNGYVTVYPNPPLNISRYPDRACAPADILLSSTPGGHTYDWDFGDGSTASGDFSILHTFRNETDRDTVFQILLVSTSFFGCRDTGITSITVHPSPVASFTADPATQMMPDRTVHFSNTTPAGNWTYLWRFGDDSISVARDPAAHIYPGPADYLITLLVKGTWCSDSTWQSVEIVPHPPVAEFKPVQPGCMPLTVQFENTSAYSNSFLWEFGDGAVSNKPNPEYTYYEPGTYKIKLTAWGDGGADTYSVVNDVWVLPKAYFEIAPRIVYVNDEPVHFFNLSDNGNTYVWDFGDGTGSDQMNPTHVYTKDGNYTVTLNVWTENNCYDLYEMETAVLVEPTGKIVFPNAFRPESPLEENRVFHPGVIDHVEEYHLMIFNRWGELIFESFDKDTGWDGYVDGKMAKQDVYVWKVEGKYSNGQTFLQTGDVTLMH
jgi:gliding motility-associated-like protein